MDTAHIAFDNSYGRLPERFYARLAPTAVSRPRLIRLNHRLAADLGLDTETLASPQGIAMLAGNHVPQGADPLAMAYAGFQFGNWVPRLGDGRAVLLGELIDRQGVRHDLHLKGAGPTPFSRGGDGRAGLGPVLREYIVSEAMAALGVPTTRSLAAVCTGDTILRETRTPGAVLARVAGSHVRVGTFQFFAAQQDVAGIQTLADYVIARHQPALADTDKPYLGLLRNAMELQAQLIAQWQAIGFIHGVMNTDNMSVIGETIDYGPCAFMDGYDPDTVLSSIDRKGRYAYGNQPAIAQWNLATFAQALLPIMGADQDAAVDEANALIQGFPRQVEAQQHGRMMRKLGLGEAQDGDAELIGDLMTRMKDHGADFTLSFRRLCDAIEATPQGDGSVSALFDDPAGFEDWAVRWRRRLAIEGRPPVELREQMRTTNPATIPRNHLIEEVIRAAVDEDDFTPMVQLIEVLESPFEEQPGRERYAAPPTPEQVVHETFCGT